ncbi:MAG: ABC-three component system middle component 2 [Saonia sp.]
MENNVKAIPFNNNVETGLRILCILNESYPRSIDLQKLVYLDYMTVHSADIDKSVESLHTAVPYRNGELLVRSSIIQKGINLFISKGLIDRVFNKTGIEYLASEYSTPYLEMLEEEYLLNLINRANWVAANFSDLPKKLLKEILFSKMQAVRNEYNIELLH